VKRVAQGFQIDADALPDNLRESCRDDDVAPQLIMCIRVHIPATLRYPSQSWPATRTSRTVVGQRHHDQQRAETKRGGTSPHHTW